MNHETVILCLTAASIGFFHTLFGPDHYLPFIVLGRARKWTLLKTGLITFLCGLGHVLSSVVLGTIGIAFGFGMTKLEVFEGFRGNIAAWLLIGFGLAYFLWGIRKAIKGKPHKHAHLHLNGVSHDHEHSHQKEHSHAHDEKRKNMTPWILFIIFVLGPCEPLIPILMYPAAKQNISSVVLVTVVFSVITIVTMLTITILASLGLSFVPLRRAERYSHAFAGSAIFLSGLAIQFLGL
jgi:ABC-type nickel/cobalt efflux system permease component RcnA